MTPLLVGRVLGFAGERALELGADFCDWNIENFGDTGWIPRAGNFTAETGAAITAACSTRKQREAQGAGMLCHHSDKHMGEMWANSGLSRALGGVDSGSSLTH